MTTPEPSVATETHPTDPTTGGSPAGTAGRDGAQSDPTALERLDVALVHRGLARSRTHAAKLVSAGRVSVAGKAAKRVSQQVDGMVEVAVEGGADEALGEVDWVSRGAVKLDRALAAFELRRAPGVVVTGRRCLDAGASTGGFTEVLLARGAAWVEAVDVGHEQLAPSLRADARVADREGTSVRGLDPAEVGGPVDLLVADLSFISLRTVLPDLVTLVRPGGQQVLMVKPQFEVGRAKLPRGGVVREAGDRVDAVLGVAATARELGWTVVAAVPSALPGPAGNLEFFLWLTSDPADGSDLGDGALARIVREAG